MNIRLQSVVHTPRTLQYVGLTLFVMLIVAGVVSALPILIRTIFGLVGLAAACALIWVVVDLVRAMMDENHEDAVKSIVYLAGLIFIIWYVIPGMSKLLPSVAPGPECVVYDYGSRFCEEYDYPDQPTVE